MTSQRTTLPIPPNDGSAPVLTSKQRIRLNLMIDRNRTDRAMFTWLVANGMSRHDAFVAIDYYVYGEPVTCQPIP